MRLPDTSGVVGEVVQSGKSIRVDDAYRDPRFDKSVDLANGFTTRNYCASRFATPTEI